MNEQEYEERSKQAALAPPAFTERAPDPPQAAATAPAYVCEAAGGGKARHVSSEYRVTVEPRPFSWWWPSSSVGSAVFGAVIGVSALTLLAFGPFAIINVLFWYLVAVFVRFVYL